jgi:hypothetical protein
MAVPDRNTVLPFLTKLEADREKFELLKKRNLTKRSDLTARQEL